MTKNPTSRRARPSSAAVAVSAPGRPARYGPRSITGITLDEIASGAGACTTLAGKATAEEPSYEHHHPPDPPGVRGRGVRIRYQHTDVCRRGRRLRRSDYPLREAPLPRSDDHRRAADGVYAELRHAGRCARR